MPYPARWLASLAVSLGSSCRQIGDHTVCRYSWLPCIRGPQFVRLRHFWRAAIAWKATLAPSGVRLVTRIRILPSASTVRRVTDRGSDSPGRCSSTTTALRSTLALLATVAPLSPSLASTLAPLSGSCDRDAEHTHHVMSRVVQRRCAASRAM